MPDDPEPSRGDLYDAPAVVALIGRLFPHSTHEVVERLTGAKDRLVRRWCKGESRVPPTLLAKLEAQDRLKAAFDADLAALIDRHAEAGLLRECMRQSLFSTVNGNSTQFDETL